MADQNVYAKFIKKGEHLAKAAAANAAELPQAEPYRVELEGTLTGMREVVAEQSLHQAQKQDASRRLKFLFDQGSRAATLLRVMIKKQYGTRSEKLVEFGMSPFRGRKSKKASPEPPSPETAVKPAASTSSE